MFLAPEETFEEGRRSVAFSAGGVVVDGVRMGRVAEVNPEAAFVRAFFSGRACRDGRVVGVDGFGFEDALFHRRDDSFLATRAHIHGLDVVDDEQGCQRVFELLRDLFADAFLFTTAFGADFVRVRHGMFGKKVRQLERRTFAFMTLLLRRGRRFACSPCRRQYAAPGNPLDARAATCPRHCSRIQTRLRLHLRRRFITTHDLLG